MKEKTPDQIRRETIPVKHNGLVYGFLGGLLGTLVWFGGWGFLHQEQVKRYPEYAASALESSFGSISLFGSKPKASMSAEHLRYALLRFGNEEHRYDSEIIRRGWYPKGENASAWVYYNGAIKPVYTDGPMLVFKWPLTLTMFTLLASLIWGLVADHRYRSSIIAGVPFDGSIVATVDEYNQEVKGDGMRYAVKPWKDR
jgi:hypothetical protein